MNEILFISLMLFVMVMNLLAFRLGKSYMFILIALYSLLMNIFVVKQFTLFGMAITGGNAMYGAIFLITDLLTEHYGEKEAFKSVWVGFISMLFFVVITQFIIAFAPNEFDFANEALITLFSVIPRILLGSFLAYLIAQNLDIYLFNKIKVLTKGRFLFLRNNGSTMISQFVDSVIFTSIGLTTFSFLPIEGIIPSSIFWEVTLLTYFIKVVVAIVDTPFIYLSYYIKPKSLN